MADHLTPIDFTHTHAAQNPLQAALIRPDATFTFGKLPSLALSVDHPGAVSASAQAMQLDSCDFSLSSAKRNPNLDSFFTVDSFTDFPLCTTQVGAGSAGMPAHRLMLVEAQRIPIHLVVQKYIFV